MTNESLVADRLLKVGAIKLNLDQPYTWASGWKSPIYCDNRRVLSFPYDRDFIKSELCSRIFELYPDVDCLAGVATAGIAWGAMAADQLKLPFLYVRPKPKEHGMGNQIEGNAEAGKSVLVIEDLISTGKSSLEVCAVLQAAGLNIAGMVAIFTYGFPKAVNAFSEAGITLHTLTNYSTLVELAIGQGLVEPSEKLLLNAWSAAPENWGK
jgi:orotate phosphoribosyltransferase